MTKTCVVVFPGSNCDRDLAVALRQATGGPVDMVWHQETAPLDGYDLIGLPGGFSYGDYLRCGAIAAHSAIVREVKRQAERGVPVLAICNGFQIALETGLLPGALIGNMTRKFVCRDVALTVANAASPFTKGYAAGQTITVPVAHHDGNYRADDETLRRLEGEGRVAFRYVDNPNGSMNDIAGILNDRGNVLGMMPHPERSAEAALGGTDGAILFQSIVGAAA